MVRQSLTALVLLTGLWVQAADVTLAEGFAWLENQCFDGRGNLFISDSTHGEVWRLFQQNDNRYRMERLQSDFRSVLGLDVDARRDEVLAVVVRLEGRWRVARNYLIAFRAESPSLYRIVAELPSRGNGLVVDGRYAYVSSGRGVLPGQGAVYRVDLDRGLSQTFARGLNDANGLALDARQRELYVAELTTGAIHVYNLETGAQVRSHRVLDSRNTAWLDDVAVDSERGWLYGTDFAKGRVVGLSLRDQAAPLVEVAVGLKNPTSVAFGRGEGFRDCSLYVTEGGGLSSRETGRRLLELPHVRCDGRHH